MALPFRFSRPFRRASARLAELQRRAGAPLLRRTTLLMVAVACVAYLSSFMVMNPGGSDSSGYINSAKLIAKGRFFAEQRRIQGLENDLPAHLYVPLGFTPLQVVHRKLAETDRFKMAPTYPLGLPALAVALAFGGSEEAGTRRAMVLMLLGSLVLTYRLSRNLSLSPAWATMGAALLAACPLFLMMSLQVMSDMPALFWTTLALLLALESGKRQGLAAAAGVAAAIAVFIRPSNALVLLALPWALGRDWRRWLLLGIGGLPGAVLWVLTNRVLFQKYIATGYGDVGLLFGWHNVLPSLRNYAETFPKILPLAACAAIPLWASRHRPERRTVGAAATWAVALPAFYAFYYHTHEDWWYLRFLLPVFPALIGLALLGLQQTSVWLGQRGSAALPMLWPALAGTAAIAALAIEIRATRNWNALKLGEGERDYHTINQCLQQHLPGNAVVFCMQASGSIFAETEWTIVRWDYCDRDLARSLYASARESGRPIFAALFPFEIENSCFRNNLPGAWTRIDEVGDKTIWRLDDPDGTTP